MAEENKLVPRENGSNGAIELVPIPARLPAWDLSPREPHLYDYLLILRKHLWLIASFMLTVVTIVSMKEAISQRCLRRMRSEEHTSELQSRSDLVCRLLLGKKKGI